MVRGNIAFGPRVPHYNTTGPGATTRGHVNNDYRQNNDGNIYNGSHGEGKRSDFVRFYCTKQCEKFTILPGKTIRPRALCGAVKYHNFIT